MSQNDFPISVFQYQKMSWSKWFPDIGNSIFRHRENRVMFGIENQHTFVMHIIKMLLEESGTLRKNFSVVFRNRHWIPSSSRESSINIPLVMKLIWFWEMCPTPSLYCALLIDTDRATSSHFFLVEKYCYQCMKARGWGWGWGWVGWGWVVKC